MAHHIVETSSVWKKKRDDLKTKRDLLFKQYTKHPRDIQLSLEIKAIDDEIAECTQKMEHETRLSRLKRGSS